MAIFWQIMKKRITGINKGRVSIQKYKFIDNSIIP